MASKNASPAEPAPEADVPTLPPATALAWSEWHVERMKESARPAIALWRPAGTTVAIGLSQKPEAELALPAVREDGVGLIRRQSGGGAVLLYPGVLCWEAFASLGYPGGSAGAGGGIRQAYAALAAPVLAGLAEVGVTAFAAGICDLSVAWNGGAETRKIAGTAQLRRRRAVLVHGTLLVDAEVDVMARYLRIPEDQPDYRRGRGHRDFCLSAAEALGIDRKDGHELFPRLARAIGAAAVESGWDLLAIPPAPGGGAAGLEREKYLSAAWNWEKRRPVGVEFSRQSAQPPPDCPENC